MRCKKSMVLLMKKGGPITCAQRVLGTVCINTSIEYMRPVHFAFIFRPFLMAEPVDLVLYPIYLKLVVVQRPHRKLSNQEF